MITLSGILIGLAMVTAGVVMVKYNFQLVGMTGHIGAVERYMGSGSTYLFFHIVAIVMIITGILIGTGLGPDFFGWVFSPLKGLFVLSK